VDSLIKFHIDNKYCVVVNKIEQGCVAHFPSNYFLENPIEKSTTTYKIVDEGFTYSLDFNTNLFKVPRYAIRFAITTDIILKTTSLNIPNKLIIINNNGVVESSLTKILSKPIDDSDIQREELMAQVYPDIVIGLFDFTSADKLGIGRGYEVLRDIIESGGLL
jgi:hypothetical protein